MIIVLYFDEFCLFVVHFQQEVEQIGFDEIKVQELYTFIVFCLNVLLLFYIFTICCLSFGRAAVFGYRNSSTKL